MAHIEASRLSKSVDTRSGRRDVLRDVSLSVEQGEFVALVGAMGSGKSTLLHVLAGLLPLDTGRLLIQGQPVTGVHADAALVFQHHALLPWFSALENVRLAVDAAFPDWPTIRQQARAREMLEQVGLGGAVDRKPRQLSGGMRQRVALARAFATEPSILFLDEPFGALDALTRETLQGELARLCAATERPVTTVMVTNSVDEAVLMADRVVSLTKGPAATIGANIAVDLAKPRDAAMLSRDAHALRVKARVIEALTDGGARLGHRAAPASATVTTVSEAVCQSEAL